MSRNSPFRQVFVCNAPRGSAPLYISIYIYINAYLNAYIFAPGLESRLFSKFLCAMPPEEAHRYIYICRYLNKYVY